MLFEKLAGEEPDLLRSHVGLLALLNTMSAMELFSSVQAEMAGSSPTSQSVDEITKMAKSLLGNTGSLSPDKLLSMLTSGAPSLPPKAKEETGTSDHDLHRDRAPKGS